MISSRSSTLLMAAALSLTVAVAPAVAQQGGASLNDAQIAHIAVTADAVDVEVGRLAEQRAENAEVKDFAAMMVRDHSAVNVRAAALAKKLGVTPEPNATSKSLMAGAKEVEGKLQQLQGAAFDRAYMDREVGYHQAVLNVLDQQLIPSTQNGELKALLTQVRPVIAAHLERAKAIRASLGGM
ncbi:MAG TPA: DUF4142 domain-containing protein [Longimicrobiaceae bacterium]|nr:DUF4142 domain-containing protein [Longimicrobiaceae bacterium]